MKYGNCQQIFSIGNDYIENVVFDPIPWSISEPLAYIHIYVVHQVYNENTS